MVVSSMLICSLIREGTNKDDTYNSDVYLLGVDFHVPLNTMGSRQDDTK